MKKTIVIGIVLVLTLVVFAFPGPSAVEGRWTALAQETTKPDSPAIRDLLDKTKATAGGDWRETFEFFCAMNPTRANRPDDPVIEPAKVLDNLYVIGRTSTAVWAVTTSAGIVLIDAGYGDQLESVLLPGMKKLGLDPAQVKYVIVGHGHADHFGGSAYFQQRGARVVMAGPDWDLIEKSPATDAVQPPKRDVVAVEGQAITIGDVAFTPVMIPGHTPGSMALVFPVKDGRTTRIAGIFGGSILTPGRLTNDGLKQYIESVNHWADATKRMKVDVEIQNHPMYDNFLTKLDRLKRRKPGEPNPFVVGADSYQRFLGVMSGCTTVQLMRRAA
jgi:metallo-beta-lactamase class B